MANHLNNTDRWAKATFCVLAVAFVAALTNHGLVPSMEPRFAEVVREMIAARDWVVPIKNGRPYVEYPVFYYWLAIGGKLLGLPMLAAIRLPTFIGFLFWLWLLGRWQNFFRPALPRFAFQIAGAALPIVLFQFSIAQTDGLLALGVLMAMYGYSRLILDPQYGGFPWVLWTGVGVAVLAKGPVGIACTLPVMGIDRIIAGLRDSDYPGVIRRLNNISHRVSEIYPIRGTLYLLLLAVPWYVAAGLHSGWEFVEAVLVYQNFDRYVTGYSHGHPWWYYFKTLTYDFFPLSLLLPVGLWAARRQFAKPEIRLVLIWFVFTFVFFSVSGSKQGKYLLPLTPALIALSLLGIEYVNERIRLNIWQSVRRWSLSFVCLFAALIIFVLPFFAGKIGGVDGFQPIRTQLTQEPGRLVHFQWPRSLTLYELGAPMAFVRSARQLYAEIAAGEIQSGDYILVRSDLLGSRPGVDNSSRLLPYPNTGQLEFVLETKAEKDLTLLRVTMGAADANVPDTPESPILHWRDQMFDTD